MASIDRTATGHRNGGCATVPDFKRLTYFHGQFLTAHDLQTEQAYFREKLKLHNRCLHGYGVVCGLQVSAVPPREDCEPATSKEHRADTERRLAGAREKHAEIVARIEAQAEGEDLTALEDERDRLAKWISHYQGELGSQPKGNGSSSRSRARVRIDCGLAIDCCGNEIVVRSPVEIDLWKELGQKDREALDEGGDVFVSLCYCEQHIEPTRTVLQDPCGSTSDCVYSKSRESFGVRVGTKAPHVDGRCDSCCDPCTDPCVVLAVVHGLAPDGGIDDEAIDVSVRRMIGSYALTTITGISWRHGGSYTNLEAREILGADDPEGGIEIAFSREVDATTLLPGVVDLYVVEGGAGKAADIYFISGEYVGVPETGFVPGFRYRQTSREWLESGDRLTVVVRAPFILDKCCQPVDGLHVGGKVPLLPEYAQFDREEKPATCLVPPTGTGRWVSGNGSGGVFESWFFIG